MGMDYGNTGSIVNNNEAMLEDYLGQSADLLDQLEAGNIDQAEFAEKNDAIKEHAKSVERANKGIMYAIESIDDQKNSTIKQLSSTA